MLGVSYRAEYAPDTHRIHASKLFAAHESGASTMGFSTDPNDRRRVDGDTQLKRDAEVARLREQHVPFRQIARRLDMSLGSVQKALARWRKRQAYLEALDAELEDELETPFSRLTFEEQNRVALAEYLADLERDPNDELARYRLRHVPTDTPGHPLAGT